MLIEAATMERENLSSGTHTGILYQLIDLGTQKNEFIKGQPKIQRRVWLAWETPEELMSDSRPFSIGKEFTITTFETAPWAKFIAATLGSVQKAVNTNDIIGKGCNLAIIHNENGKAKVDGFAPLKKSDKVPALFNKPLVFDLSNFDKAVFETLPSFLTDKIKLSPEYIDLSTKN